jgi:hypothetical protein
MPVKVTLSIPNDVLEKATRWANFMGRPVENFLTETIQSSLPSLGPVSDLDAIPTWSDDEVIAATEEDLSPAVNNRLSELLQKQQAGALGDAEKKELQTLMVVYQTRLLRKARALNEAVSRGLKEPLQP